MEKWCIVNQSSNYEISNQGRLRNKKGRILNLNINKRGYLYCNISINSVVSKVKIHRLVAIAFISNPHNLETVNHKDLNKLNNKETNLEWTSRADNIRHYHNFKS